MLLHLLQGPQEKPGPHGDQRGGGQPVGHGHREGHQQHAKPEPAAEERTVSFTAGSTSAKRLQNCINFYI